MRFKNLLRPLLDALYPPVCLLCGQESEGPYPHCCEECFGEFEPVRSCCPGCGLPFRTGQTAHLCLSCLTRRKPFAWCRSLYVYQPPLSTAILRFKYGRSMAMMAPLKDAFLRGAMEIQIPPPEAVIPVPMGFWRNVRRGFNQAQVFAEPLARRLGVPLEARALVRYGRPQVGLTRAQRQRNAATTVQPGPALPALDGRRVLLVDDVYTTGATARACARVLGSVGAKVSVLTLARAAIWGQVSPFNLLTIQGSGPDKPVALTPKRSG